MYTRSKSVRENVKWPATGPGVSMRARVGDIDIEYEIAVARTGNRLLCSSPESSNS